MKLSLKFALISGLVLLLIAGISSAILIHHQDGVIQEEVRQRALTVLSFGEACRDYANKQLRPKVTEMVDRNKESMIFEGQSATFVARGTFEELAARLPEYSFREASLNPLNLANKATPEEEKIIAQFQNNPELKEQSGFVKRNGREYFFVARPIAVDSKCLKCHDSPEKAPADVVSRYGKQHGYGWKVGDLSNAIMVSVPAHDIKAQQAGMVKKTLGLFAAAILILFGVSYYLFETLVNRRVRRAAGLMEQVAANPASDARLDANDSDELGIMAQSFNSMADSLLESQRNLEKRVSERTAELARANDQLKQEVDGRRKIQADAHRAKTAAEAADNAKSQFLARTSQQVRAPINDIIRTLDRVARAESNPSQKEALRAAANSANSVLTLIDDLTDFSRLEVGKLQLKIVSFDIRDVVEKAIKTPALRAEAKKISLTTFINPQAPRTVIGDPIRLRQALFSIVDNAVKYTAQGGVKVSVESFAAKDSKVGLHFVVSDTGIGIPAWKKKQLFDPAGAENGELQQTENAGFGLVIAASLVELMGGTIRVESQVGQGSTFHIEVPLASAAAAPVKPVGVSPGGTQSLPRMAARS